MNKKTINNILMMFLGLFLVSLSFNLFLLPNNIVSGGISGVSIIVQNIFNIDPSIFIFISSLILLVFSFIFLGFNRTKGTIVGSLLMPLFIKLTENISDIIVLNTDDKLLISIFAGITTGTGLGLIFKAGASTGGTDIINLIFAKYLHVSLGSAMLFTDGLIILASGYFFGIENILYSTIILYLLSKMTDKIILGVSSNKAIFIISKNTDNIINYINNKNIGLTVFDATGGFSNEKTKMLMCAISSHEYFKFKEDILFIDKDAFFIVSNAYEVSEKRKIM